MQCINDGSGETGNSDLFMQRAFGRLSALASSFAFATTAFNYSTQPTTHSTMKAPVFFISHGGKWLFKRKTFTSDSLCHLGPNLLEDKEKPGEFYNWFGRYLKQLKPSAIVVISAHWQGQGKNGIFGKCHLGCEEGSWCMIDLSKLTVDTSEKPELIYDFYNFPQRYYEQTWDHQGSPLVAEKVIGLLKQVCHCILLWRYRLVTQCLLGWDQGDRTTIWQ